MQSLAVLHAINVYLQSGHSISGMLCKKAVWNRCPIEMPCLAMDSFSRVLPAYMGHRNSAIFEKTPPITIRLPPQVQYLFTRLLWKLLWFLLPARAEMVCVVLISIVVILNQYFIPRHGLCSFNQFLNVLSFNWLKASMAIGVFFDPLIALLSYKNRNFLASWRFYSIES